MIGALASAVPAEPAFFPFRAFLSLADDDLAGSGFETSESRDQPRAAWRDDSNARQSVRRWREIAISARRIAQSQEIGKRARLLELAEWCEAQADRLEKSEASS
jgi:hypothetical protein